MFHTRYIACMEQTKPSRLSSAARHETAESFGRWLRDRMSERDYGGRGGQARLSTETGLAPSVISRLLKGTTLNPDPESLRLVSEVLALPFAEVLIRAGTLTEDDLRRVNAAPPMDRPPITPEEAARDLGIVDPIAVRLFVANVEAARAAQQERSDRERAR
jgi:transcriptional regulator with XRE-family HTH domain